ncbi:hypothetical protein [Corynebacterium halotolerans]|uniref:Uncharacterized protein n=1 Tax=Corynebacterium halotolerans YIM 70093 = DSM 44683 TaxID=1121362 RepID=M1NP61_9CORY|nr:hypothetical protein [Corynebacterium halotolerans]AGF71297.1 hypothetical protein A605_01415 [Corynebacterium halotolerans YIM 70093 = DSM 44683]
MALNDKSSGDPAVANDHDAEDLTAAREALEDREGMTEAEKAPDGAFPESDVDDVHRDFLVGQDEETVPDGDGPSDAPFTMPDGRTEGVPDEDR